MHQLSARLLELARTSLLLAMSTTALVGCADPCAELQDLCDLCLNPDQRASCERSVDEDTDEVCEQNIDSYRTACQ